MRHRRGETLERLPPQLDAFLREILAKVQTATDVESILQIAVRELGQALNAPRAVVQLSVEDQPERGPAIVSAGSQDLGEGEE